jgi:hypothetical protein
MCGSFDTNVTGAEEARFAGDGAVPGGREHKLGVRGVWALV